MDKDNETLEVYEHTIKANDVVKVDENPDIMRSKWGREYSKKKLLGYLCYSAHYSLLLTKQSIVGVTLGVS